MQFRNLVTFSLFGFALAAPAAVGDLTNAMTAIATSINAFDAAIVAATASTDPKTLTAKGAAIKTTIIAQTAAVEKSTGNISVVQATSMISAANGLNEAAKKSIENVIAKKQLMTTLGLKADVLKQLTEQKGATEKFVAAVASKLPKAVQSISESQGKLASDAIQKGIDAYKA